MAELASWNDGHVKSALVDFVAHVNNDIPPEQRVAVFDYHQQRHRAANDQYDRGQR